MMYEIIIGLGVLVYIAWKYLISAKEERKQVCKDAIQTPVLAEKIHVKCGEIELKEPLIKQKSHEQQSSKIIKDGNKPVCDSNISLCHNIQEKFVASTKSDKKVNVFDKLRETKTDYVSKNVGDILKEPLISKSNIQHHNNNTQQEITNDGIITPSLLLKQQKEKTLNEKIGKRESPPKERLAEFLEKTIFSDDKIQSIIDNLSLHQTEVKHETPISKETLKSTEHRNSISEKASQLQNSIDQIADRIKSFNNNSAKENDKPIEFDNDTKKLQEKDIIKESVQTECDGQLEENKPLLKRIQKQSGFPAGLNFGSVIGELKNKTKNANNGALKPVFKKFDTDTVDNVQACFVYLLD